MIPLIVGAAIGCIITKTRPSTVVRLGEDAVVFVGRKASGLVRSTKLEYKARMYAKATEAIHKADQHFENMSAAQRKQATKDEAAILARAAELVAERRAKGKAPRASRKGSEAAL